MPVLSDSEWERIVMPRVFKCEDSDCWYWFGSTNQQGHGNITYNGRTAQVHALSLARKMGREIRPTLQANHYCYQNKNCVNPAHLYEGTNSDNQIDAIKDGSRLTKITPAQVVAIRADTRTQTEIAKEYGISQPQVCEIKLRRKWKHIT